MKPILICAALFLVTGAIYADQKITLTKANGQKLENVTIYRIEPDSITVMTDSGSERIQLADLTDDLKTKFGYDPEKVARVQKERADRIRMEAQMKVQRAHDQAIQKIKDQTKTVREAKSDMLSLIGKPFILTGKLDVDSSYHWGYERAQGTHFSFRMIDPSQCIAYLYMDRAKGADVRDKLIQAKSRLRASCIVVILQNRFESGASSLVAELLDVKFLPMEPVAPAPANNPI